jgi:hypothetical protein
VPIFKKGNRNLVRNYSTVLIIQPKLDQRMVR